MQELREELAVLRERIEAALRASSSRGTAASRSTAIALLHRMLKEAPKGSSDACYANRQLAELLIESHPWQAALHLRALRDAGQEDDSIYGLLGLSHALLGNFQTAVGAYRRALALAPRNPWYHHNLGHLLDAALALPAEALSHLKIAHGLEPDEPEITASLAHCTARLGHIREARELAVVAFGEAPKNADQAALLEWIDKGARGKGAFPMARRAKRARRSRAG